jgi:hypothetical protein
LQAVSQFGAHAWRYVAVHAAHSGYLVAHSLGLKDVPDTQLVKPRLVAVS